MDECPTCYREFKDFRDYPRIRVHGVELATIYQVPEVIENKMWTGSYNHALNVRNVLQNDHWVRSYLEGLEELVGKEASSDDFLPKWDPELFPITGEFYTVPINDGFYIEDSEVKVDDSKVRRGIEAIHLSVGDGSEPEKRNEHRIANVKLYSHVHSVGYIHLFVIGNVEYEGLLVPRA